MAPQNLRPTADPSQQRRRRGSHHPTAVRRRRTYGLAGVAIVAYVAYSLGLPLTGGHLAIDVLLVTIGFDLAGTIRGASPRSSWLKRFWLTRLARIAAPVLVAVGLVVSYAAWQGGLDEPQLRAVLGAVTMSLNLFTVFGGADYMAIEHLWLVGLIFQFVVVAPLLVRGGRRLLGLRRRAVALALIAAAVSIARLALILYGPVGDGLAPLLVVRFDGLLLGLALGVVPLARLRTLLPSGIATPAFLVLLTLFVVAPRPEDMPLAAAGLLIPLVVLASALVLGTLAAGTTAPALATTLDNGVLRWLGERAIGIYIWHHLFGVVIDIGGIDHLVTEPATASSPTWPGLAVFVVQVVFSLAAGATSHRYLEVPATVAISHVIWRAEAAEAAEAEAEQRDRPEATIELIEDEAPTPEKMTTLSSAPPSIFHIP